MKQLSLYLFLVLISISCGKQDDPEVVPNNPDSPQEWLIPENEVFDGGPGKDGIPSIDDPKFISVNDVNYLEEEDLVVVVVINGQAKVYPHKILNYHEIVNDRHADSDYSLTYCPLTGTTIVWDRRIKGELTTFGVSGLLYNSNLIPYDRATDSYWSQLYMSSVHGVRKGLRPNVIPSFETKWTFLKRLYPHAKVLSTETGYDVDYQQYPYGSYLILQDWLIFPVKPEDHRLPLKQRVFGLLGESAEKVYKFDLFETPVAIHDFVGENEFLIIGSETDNFIIAFINDGLVNFEVSLATFPQSELPIIGTDANGNKLDITGKIVEGPLEGKQLLIPNSFMGYWFSIAAFYPNIEIHE